MALKKGTKASQRTKALENQTKTKSNRSSTGHQSDAGFKLGIGARSRKGRSREAELTAELESRPSNERYSLRRTDLGKPATAQQTSRAKPEPKKRRASPSSPKVVKAPPAQPVAARRSRSTSPRLRGIRAWAESIVDPDPAGADSVDNHSSDTAACFRAYGYLPPDSDMNAKSASTSQLASGAGKKRNQKVDATSSHFYRCLIERNVSFDALEDPRRKDNEKLIPSQFLPKPNEEEEHWTKDLEKCETEGEAVYQRTIMMEILDRHRLDGKLDYACESPWKCMPMPQRQPALRQMCQPKPDLTVAFKRRELLKDIQILLLGGLRGHICPEAFNEQNSKRAFYFFSVETKGAKGEANNSTALRQNLNTASQGLYNMYMVMREAKKVDQFLEKVRFFSAVATSAGVHFRVHRAVMLKESEGRMSDEYPLGYHFDNMFSIRGGRYTKAEVSGIVRNILIDYGVGTLLPILKAAVNTILKNLHTEEIAGEEPPAEGSPAETQQPSKRQKTTRASGENLVQDP